MDGVAWSYTVAQGEVTVVGVQGAVGEQTLPTTLGGLPVVAVGAEAFASADELMKLTIPEGVVRVGENAFAGADALNEVDFYGAMPEGLATAGLADVAAVKYRYADAADYRAVVTKDQFAGFVASDPVTVPATVTGGTWVFTGEGHGVSVSVAAMSAHESVAYATSAEGPWQDVPVTYADAGTYTVWTKVSATGYEPFLGSAVVTIDRASFVAAGGEEPGTGEAEEGACSKYDVASVYTGTEHTIDVSALETMVSTVYASVVGVEVSYGLTSEGPWTADPAAFKNVTESSVWYRLSAPSYNDYVHEAKVTITPRAVTLTSADGSWTFDGQAHQKETVTVGNEGFVAGEGATYSDFAAITNFGTVENAFSYALSEGTLAGNYDITVVNGTLAIGQAALGGFEVADKWQVTLAGDAAMYDGTAKTVAVTDAAYDGLPVTYTVSNNTQVDAGTYALTLTGTGNFTGTQQVAWSIVPRTVTLTSGTATKVYDGTALTSETFAVSGNGFVGEEGAVCSYTGAQTVVGASANTFAYQFAAGTKATNYDVSTVEGTLTVTAATIGGGAEGLDEPGAGVVAEGGTSKFDRAAMYDGEAHTVDVEALGNLTVTASDVTVMYALDAEGPWQADAPTFTNAGEYSVWYKLSAPNYVDYVHEAKVTVTKRPVTLVSADGSWTFDGEAHANPSVTIDGEGFVSGEGVNFDNFAWITNFGTADNTFTYELADGTLADNYDITVVNGTLVIGQAAIGGFEVADKWTVTLDGDAAMYDGTAKTVKVTAAAYDGLAVTFTVSNNTQTDAGNYALTITGTGNFSGTHTVPWSIVKRQVTLTSSDATKMYDGTALKNETVTVGGDGFAANEGNISRDFSTQTNVGACENAFAYELNANTKASNYVITQVYGTLEVTKRSVTLTSGSAAKVYDGAALTAQTFAVSGDGFVEGEGAVCSYTGSQTVVGASANTFAYELNEGTLADNYTIATANGTLTVTAASIGGGADGTLEPGVGEVAEGGVSLYDATAMYDGAAHTVDTEALAALTVTASEVTVMYALDAEGPWQADAPTFTNAGEYSVWYKLSAPNYVDYIHEAKVTVTKRPVTLTSADGSWTFDGQAHSAPTVTVGGEGFVDGEGATYSDFATITNFGTAENTFSYALCEGTLADNYDVTVVNGTLAIGQAALGGFDVADKWSVSLEGDAAMYDGTAKTVNFTAVSYDGLPITYTVSGNTQTNAGSYTLTITGTGNFSGTHTIPWTIAKRKVSLTSGSAAKVYDGTPLVNETVTVGGDGFVAGEGVTYKFTGAQTNVGTGFNNFTYQAQAGTLVGNYMVQMSVGTLRVTKRAITVTAEAKTQEEGAAEVPLTYVAEGLCGTDTLEGALTREPGTTIGTYAILVGTLADPNYSITFVGANYEIVSSVVLPEELKDRAVFDAFKAWLVAHKRLTEGATDGQVAEMAAVEVPAKGTTLLDEFIAGTDPDDATSRVKTLITMDGQKPVVRWEPALNGVGVRTGVRVYRVFGAKTYGGPWTEIAEGDEVKSGAKFFKVSVALP